MRIQTALLLPAWLWMGCSPAPSPYAWCEVHYLQDDWEEPYQVDRYDGGGRLSEIVAPSSGRTTRFGYDSKSRKVLEAWDEEGDGIDEARTWWLYEGDKLDRIEDDLGADDLLDSWTEHAYDGSKLVYEALHDSWNDDRIVEAAHSTWQGDNLVMRERDGNGDGTIESTETWLYDGVGRATQREKTRAIDDYVERSVWSYVDLDGGGTEKHETTWWGEGGELNPGYETVVTATYPDGRTHWVERRQRDSGFVYQREDWLYDAHKRLMRVGTDWSGDGVEDTWLSRVYNCSEPEAAVED